MESLHYDPITHHPYDLTVHVPHIVPCCGETCAITTIHHAKSTTNKCPFCAEALPDAGWLVNKLVFRMLSAQAKAPDHGSGSLLRPKNLCSLHHDQSASMICIDDNMLLCSKCVSETRHHGHQVQDLSQCLQLLTTGLAQVKSKVAAVRTRCEQALAKVHNEAMTQLQAKLNEQTTESERVLEQLLLLQASGHSSSMVSIKDAQALCRKVLEMDAEEKAAGLEKEMRAEIERWLEEQLQCARVRQNREVKEIRGECLKTLKSHTRSVWCLQMLLSGQLASGSEKNTIKIWDTTTATCLKTLKDPNYWVSCLQMLPSGQLASGSGDNTIKVWDTIAGTCLKTLQGHTSYVLCLQLLPCGQLASGSGDNTIKIWDTTAATCLKTFQGHTNKVPCLQMLPPRQLASGSYDNTIKIWDTTTGTCLKTLQGHTSSVFCLQMLPSGQLASGSYDKTIKIWDTATATCLKTLQGHTSYVHCLQMLPSDQLASGSGDGTIKIWNTTAATCLKTLQGHKGSVYCLRMLPSGQLVSGSDDTTIKIWA